MGGSQGGVTGPQQQVPEESSRHHPGETCAAAVRLFPVLEPVTSRSTTSLSWSQVDADPPITTALHGGFPSVTALPLGLFSARHTSVCVVGRKH